MREVLKHILCYLILVVLAFNPVLSNARSLIELDRSARQNTRILKRTDTGLIVQNINTPNDKGTSLNKFKKFNVGKAGLIINNGSFVSDSVLGKKVRANPNLTKGKEASTIINQVTSRNETKLLGPTELVGKRANYVLINPNRIICDGCDFINIPRATLTTATPKFKDDELETLNIEGGSILINGNAVNLKGVDKFDLITKTAEIASKIEAEDLNIIAGLAEINYKDNQILNIVDTEEKPEIAIDVKSLGGMYANQIKLIAVNEGVGINSEGEISGSNVYIDANGDVIFGRIAAKGDNIDLLGSAIVATDSLNVNANNLNIEEMIHADNINLYIKEQIYNNSNIKANKKIDLKSSKLINKGEINSEKNATIKSDELINESIINAEEELLINGKNILNANAVILKEDVIEEQDTVNIIEDSKDDINKLDDSIKLLEEAEEVLQEVEENILVNVDNEEQKNTEIASNSNELVSEDSNFVEILETAEKKLEEDILVDTPETIEAEEEKEENIASIRSKKITIESEKIINKSHILASKEMLIDGNLINEDKILSNKMVLTSDQIDNSGLITSVDELTINSEVINNNANLESYNTKISTTELNNKDTILGIDSLTINGDKVINDGDIISYQKINITSKELDNNSEIKIMSNNEDQKITIDSQKIDNSGLIISNGELDITTDNIVNAESGEIVANDNLDIKGKDEKRVDNLVNKGKILAKDTLKIYTDKLENIATIYAARNQINAKIINNQNAKGIRASKSLTINTDKLNNKNGSIGVFSSFDKNAQIASDFTGPAITININDNYVNDGVIESGGAINLTAKNVSNNNKIAAEGDVTISSTSGNIDNAKNAEIISNSKLSLNSNGDVNNSGLISSVGDLTINANNVNNQTAQISTDSNLNIKANNINNNGQSILYATKDINLNIANNLNNNSSDIYSFSNIKIEGASNGQRANKIINNSGRIEASGNMTLRANQVENNGNAQYHINDEMTLVESRRYGVADESGDFNLFAGYEDYIAITKLDMMLEKFEESLKRGCVMIGGPTSSVSGSCPKNLKKFNHTHNMLFWNDQIWNAQSNFIDFNNAPNHPDNFFIDLGRYGFHPADNSKPGTVIREVYEQKYNLTKPTTGRILSGVNMDIDTNYLKQNKSYIYHGNNLNMLNPNTKIENDAISLKKKFVYKNLIPYKASYIGKPNFGKKLDMNVVNDFNIENGVLDLRNLPKGLDFNTLYTNLENSTEPPPVRVQPKEGDFGYEWINEKEQEVIVSSISGGGTFTFRGKSIDNKITLYEKENIDLNKLSITNTSKLTETNLALDKEFIKP